MYLSQKLWVVCVVVMGVLSLSACGTTTTDRAASGGLFGAAAGAAIGSLYGDAGDGAVIGGVVGAAAGAVIDPCSVHLGHPIWRDQNASREDYYRRCGPSNLYAVGTVVSGAFDVAAKQTIQNYFRTYPIAPQWLPPGIARNLARGKPLPPGIAKRFLPSDLQARLPVYSGYEMLISGRNVLLVSITSGIITDILLDVV